MRKIAGYLIGERVEISPATDAWMQGDRFGAVTKVGRKYVYVKMDKSGRTLKLIPAYIMGAVFFH